MPRGKHDPAKARSRPRLLELIAAALALAVAGGAPDDKIVESFEAAVARLKGPAGSPPGILRKTRVGLDSYRSEAESLAKTHGSAAAGFLRSRTSGPDPDAARLALLTLALLADDGQAATELSGCFKDSDYRHGTVLMALTYAPAHVALAVGEEALTRYDPRGRAEPLIAASTLFRFFGDRHCASELEGALARPLPRGMKPEQEAANNLVALRQRLAKPSEEQGAWSAQDVIVWRAVRSMGNSQSQANNLRMQAMATCRQTRFTPAYLKNRLVASSIDFLELQLLFEIAEIQRDRAVIPELARFLETRQGPWGGARRALLSIGTREALAPVERLITPPKAPSARAPIGDMSPERLEVFLRDQLIRTVCQDLARCGDRETLKLMESLATDTAYPPQERAAFTRARDALRTRVGTRP